MGNQPEVCLELRTIVNTLIGIFVKLNARIEELEDMTYC